MFFRFYRFSILILMLVTHSFVSYSEEKEAMTGMVEPLRKVGIDQNLNSKLDPNLIFRRENGQEVRLGDLFRGKPVILAIVYYQCPMLCNQVLNGLLSSLRVLSFDAGKEFDIITVSFLPHETPQMAAEKKKTYVARYKRAGAENGWHFLTGTKESIDSLTKTVGFRYSYDAKSNQYAHASAIMVVTPEHKLSSYFYGIDYPAKDLRLSLVEASANKIGSPVDQLLLYCYHYDPETGKYGLVIRNILQLAGLLTLIGLASMILLLKQKQPDEKNEIKGTA
jgi:protein SCO1